MRMSKNNILLLIVLIIFGAATAHADITHYINSNVGDRASGLAGAYTAISDDSSGCYYNPAGIVLSPANKFSASVNALSTSTKVYKGVLNKQGGGTQDWDQESFNLLPNFFGIVQKFGPGMLGFSYAVPDSTQMRQKQIFQNTIGIDSVGTAFNIDTDTIDINEYDKTYLFGPSYSYELTDSISVGGTLYYYYRDHERIFNRLVETESGPNIALNLHSTLTEQGIKPILGFIYDPMENLSLGLTVSKTWILDTNIESKYIQIDSTDPANFSKTVEKYTDNDKFPLNISLGLAWFYTPSILFSCDVKYYDAISYKNDVINVAIATEFYPSDVFAVRTGFYTDMSNAPDVTADSILEQIDLFGYCISGTFFSGKSSVTLGVDWGFGTGDANPLSVENTVYDVEYNSLTFHLSTSFTY